MKKSFPTALAIIACLIYSSCKPDNVCPSNEGGIRIYKEFKFDAYGANIDTTVYLPYFLDRDIWVTIGANEATEQTLWKLWVVGKTDTLRFVGKEAFLEQPDFGVTTSSILSVELFDNQNESCPLAKREFDILPKNGQPTLIKEGKYLGKDTYSQKEFMVELDSFFVLNPRLGIVEWSIKGLPDACQFPMSIWVLSQSLGTELSSQQARGCKEFGAWGLFDPETGRLVVHYEVEDSLGVMRNDRFIGLLQ